MIIQSFEDNSGMIKCKHDFYVTGWQNIAPDWDKRQNSVS